MISWLFHDEMSISSQVPWPVSVEAAVCRRMLSIDTELTQNDNEQPYHM